ncbi:MAG: DUF805 domain-containing protein [Haliea sp.]|nr:DUF805 domain-containing protein [Haliea sp.]
MIILPYLEGDSANSVPGEALGPTMVTILLYAIIPAWVRFQVKRWHDIDKSGRWIMINLITIIGNVITLFMCGFQKVLRRESSVGDNPLQPDRQSQIPSNCGILPPQSVKVLTHCGLSLRPFFRNFASATVTNTDCANITDSRVEAKA